jgi:septal ring factor EnvC (AmiA/AmiB activator)
MKLQELHQEDQDEIQMLSKEIKEQKRIINKIKLQYKQQGHTLKESIIEMNEVNG